MSRTSPGMSTDIPEYLLDIPGDVPDIPECVPDIGKHLVNDHFSLGLKIVTLPQP
jgi:hypothetical protein